MLKVYNECCNNCLLSKDRIVSAKRAKELVEGCKREQTHFICHKASIDGKEILCRAFFNKFGFHSQLVRIAVRLNAIVFVEQTDKRKLTPYTNLLPFQKKKSPNSYL